MLSITEIHHICMWLISLNILIKYSDNMSQGLEN